MPKGTLSNRDVERLLGNQGDLSDLFDRCARNPALLNDVILLGDVAHGIANPGSVPNAGHPEPGLLARYHLSRGSLEEADLTRISQHLEECSNCASDLKALAAFDFTKLPRPAVVRGRSPSRSLVDRL